MKKRVRIISIAVLAMVCPLVAIVIMTYTCEGNHWDYYSATQYEFINVEVRSEFENWIDSLYHSYPLKTTEIKRMDYDLCYQKWIDTIWDQHERFVIDSFNVRLHSHSYQNDYLRAQNWKSDLKGCCRIGRHIIYLYDDTTINKLFVKQRRNIRIIKHIDDNHGFLDWQDEEVWVAYMKNDHLRSINTNNRSFSKLDFLFYSPLNPTNQSQFIERINVDSFTIRGNGPYLLLSNQDSLTKQTTKDNMRLFIQGRLSQEDLENMDTDTRIHMIFHIDTLGKYSCQNVSTVDIRMKVDSICMLIPNFTPAMRRGKPVNSTVIFNFCKGDFVCLDNQ